MTSPGLLRSAFFLIRKDTLYLLRRPETWLWTFGMPVLFIYFFGTILSGFGGSGGKDSLTLGSSPGAGFLVDHLARQLERLGYQVARVDTRAALDRSATARLWIPESFTADVLKGHPVKVDFTRTGNDLAAEYDQIRVRRALAALQGDLATIAARGETPTDAALQRLAAEPRPLTLKVEAAGQRPAIPSGFEQAVPGNMVMFCLLVLFTTGAATLLIERQQSILMRLAASPMSRTAVLLGKWGSRMALGVVQLAFAMLAATVLFHVSWGPHILMVGAVLLAYAALAAAMGMLLGNFARTRGQVVGVGVITTNVLAAIGGCWWPIEITPEWAQKAALFVPTGIAMNALHKLMSFGDPPASVLWHIAVLAALAVIAGIVTARGFRFR